ncbi:Arc family DNA-binding protein [Tolumonas lignilytica]|uniref:Arc family DNA-binding protein n=1 Tax=Tolumonas lignilytica TaxID=1283284 RepID=UPI0004630ECF|nr:Arc family DNA-binding protein [Tolumonas lignilytica]
MNDEIQKTALRLPKSLHEAIHAAAKESGRTMNAEIVYRLQQSFERVLLQNEAEDRSGRVEITVPDGYKIYHSHQFIRTLDEAIRALEGISKSVAEISEGNDVTHDDQNNSPPNKSKIE